MILDNFKLDGKTALVTGCNRGIGKACAIALAEAGANIIGVSHSGDMAETANLIKDIGHSFKSYACDFSIRKELYSFIKKLNQDNPKIDILVNNSALFYPTALGKVTETDWYTFHDLNLKAAFFLSQEIGMQMKEKGSGKIINIGDTSYNSPWPDYLPYTFSKAGINSMTQGLAKALAPEVLVNCINPGPVMIPTDYSEKQHAKAIQRTLLKRVGTAEDIAKTVRFLIESDYITGALIPVDGGRHLG